jgi:hypothetical protein
VLVLCFVERKEFSMQIASKLGSSFSLVPFIIVVVSFDILVLLLTTLDPVKLARSFQKPFLK